MALLPPISQRLERVARFEPAKLKTKALDEANLNLAGREGLSVPRCGTPVNQLKNGGWLSKKIFSDISEVMERRDGKNAPDGQDQPDDENTKVHAGLCPARYLQRL